MSGNFKGEIEKDFYGVPKLVLNSIVENPSLQHKKS